MSRGPSTQIQALPGAIELLSNQLTKLGQDGVWLAAEAAGAILEVRFLNEQPSFQEEKLLASPSRSRIPTGAPLGSFSSKRTNICFHL